MRFSKNASGIISRVAMLLSSIAAILAVGLSEIGTQMKNIQCIRRTSRDGLLNDAHDWSVGGPVLIVIENTTRNDETLGFQVLNALDSRMRDEHYTWIDGLDLKMTTITREKNRRQRPGWWDHPTFDTKKEAGTFASLFCDPLVAV
jgi:hypothetical protein